MSLDMEKDEADIKVHTSTVVQEDLESDTRTEQYAGPDPHRGLRMRHVQLIAICGSIGAALFVSIGSPLTSAGPAGLLIGVTLWASVIVAASGCLMEMSSLLPVDGGFVTFTTRFVDKSMGLAIGWNVSVALSTRRLAAKWLSGTADTSTSSPSGP